MAQPEVLTIGSKTPRSLLWVAVVAVVLVLALGGVAGWRQVQKDRQTLTMAEVETVLQGLDPAGSVTVRPLRRGDFGYAGAGSLDSRRCDLGFPWLTSYWNPSGRQGLAASVYLPESGQSPVYSVYTLTFADADAGRTAFRNITQSIAACQGVAVPIPDGSRATYRIEDETATLGDSDRQAAYNVFLPRSADDPAGFVFPIHLLQYGNTISWELRNNGDERAPQDTRAVIEVLDRRLSHAWRTRL
ncbi:hypothetical protein JOE57_001630 [Microlunatus panaciterrae]|uniref:PknH-like extracellular domain-containing protein n=1 Tax=Microlunatus panaciterrae TaxID=400768 RepID=A0ABS2RLB8_9ACTN|nr:hypothetical protein [Microlunatus panaciterrae]MBM7798709.1 hypothetical protein [Microlunatus panaciterrae]